MRRNVMKRMSNPIGKLTITETIIIHKFTLYANIYFFINTIRTGNVVYDV